MIGVTDDGRPSTVDVDRMDPPSVAAATDIVELAVWNESIDIIESVVAGTLVGGAGKAVITVEALELASDFDSVVGGGRAGAFLGLMIMVAVLSESSDALLGASEVNRG